MLAGDLHGANARFDRACNAFADGLLRIPNIEVFTGNERDVTKHEVANQAVRQTVNDAGVARTVDGKVIKENAANHRNLR